MNTLNKIKIILLVYSLILMIIILLRFYMKQSLSLISFDKKAILAIQSHFRLSNFDMLVLVWIKGLWTGILISLIIHYYLSK